MSSSRTTGCPAASAARIAAKPPSPVPPSDRLRGCIAPSSPSSAGGVVLRRRQRRSVKRCGPLGAIKVVQQRLRSGDAAAYMQRGYKCRSQNSPETIRSSGLVISLSDVPHLPLRRAKSGIEEALCSEDCLP